MTQELNQQVEGEAGAGPEGQGATEPTSSGPTTEDIQTQINAAVEAAIQEYEGKGGHLAKLRSSYDTKIAELRRQMAQQSKSRTDEALAMVDTDPAKAAQLLAGIVQAQAEMGLDGQKRQELADWQSKIMTELGYDLTVDEEAAQFAAEWAERILTNPQLSWDFQQEVAKKAVGREGEARKQVAKELQELKDGLGDTIDAAVTRALASAGIVPDPSEGKASSPRDDDWRDKSAGELVKEGLAERIERATSRT